MADVTGGAAQREEAERQRLSDTAADVSRAALSDTLLVAAQAAIRAVQRDSGKGAIGEPAADLRRLRTDPTLMLALRRDMATARQSAALLCADALWTGYRTGLDGRARAMSTSRLQIVASADEADREELVDYPVLGFTTAEIAESLTGALREGVDRALAAPLTGTIDPAAIPAALSAVAEAHAQRVAGAVGECYQAGIQAAVRALGAALVGER